MDEAGAQITEITGDTLPQDGRKIIRNTSLTVETTEFDESAVLLKQAVTQAGGYIEYSSQYAGGSTRSAMTTASASTSATHKTVLRAFRISPHPR